MSSSGPRSRKATAPRGGRGKKSSPPRNGGRKSESLVLRVYHEIQDRILYKIWDTGYQAMEQELADELGVSRTPVREALIRLQRDGLVEVVPRHGMRVLPISLSDIQEIHQILTSLEALAVELAAARQLSPKELDTLERSTRRMDEAHAKSDIRAWAQADEDFHRNLVDLSGNRNLIAVVDNFWSRAKRARLTMLSLRKTTAESTREHALLLDAIRKGQPAHAREILENHRRRGITNLARLMEERRDILLL